MSRSDWPRRIVLFLLLVGLPNGARARNDSQLEPGHLLPLGAYSASLTRQFTPLRHVPRGTYAAYTTSDSLEQVVARLMAGGHSTRFGGAWKPEITDLAEAFGTIGRYDRYKLARLYGGVRPRVARGPILRGGRVVASLTLITPHPDASLDRLLPGTLIILARVPDPAGVEELLR